MRRRRRAQPAPSLLTESRPISWLALPPCRARQADRGHDVAGGDDGMDCDQHRDGGNGVQTEGERQHQHHAGDAGQARHGAEPKPDRRSSRRKPIAGHWKTRTRPWRMLSAMGAGGREVDPSRPVLLQRDQMRRGLFLAGRDHALHVTGEPFIDLQRRIQGLQVSGASKSGISPVRLVTLAWYAGSLTVFQNPSRETLRRPPAASREQQRQPR